MTTYIIESSTIEVGGHQSEEVWSHKQQHTKEEVQDTMLYTTHDYGDIML